MFAFSNKKKNYDFALGTLAKDYIVITVDRGDLLKLEGLYLVYM